MDEKPKINLKQYQPKKGRYIYLIKVLIYAVIVVGLLVFIFIKLNEQVEKKESIIDEIHRFQLEED